MSTYAVSDLHGYKILYNEIKKFLKPEDKVICLGDCADRGPDGWETIKTVYADPQFVYLKGNHEDMLTKAMKDFIQNDMMDYNYMLVCQNGGRETFESWLRRYQDNNQIGISWYSAIKRLPLSYVHESEQGFKLILTHAGYTPYEDRDIPEEDELLWDRNHHFDLWIDCPKDVIMVHGHTPIQYLTKDYDGIPDGAFWYCGNHKVDIDCGTPSSGRTVLLDLDTFDEHIFDINQ